RRRLAITSMIPDGETPEVAEAATGSNLRNIDAERRSQQFPSRLFETKFVYEIERRAIEKTPKVLLQGPGSDADQRSKLRDTPAAGRVLFENVENLLHATR